MAPEGDREIELGAKGIQPGICADAVFWLPTPRPSDAPELALDYRGHNFWLDKLNSFNGNFAEAEMVQAFLLSSE